MGKSVKETTDMMIKSVKQATEPVVPPSPPPSPHPPSPAIPQSNPSPTMGGDDKGSKRGNWRLKAEKVAMKMSSKINQRKGTMCLSLMI